jgi:conjugative transfer region protein TrbK
MDGKVIARLGAIVFIALVAVVAALEAGRQEDAPIQRSVVPADSDTFDRLRATLIRCAEIGDAGPRDPTCLRAWAESRRRFLDPEARSDEPVPEPPQSHPPATAPRAPAGPLQPDEAR